MFDKFGVPPFSILLSDQGYWRERKREWLNYGIKSEIGRDAVIFSSSAQPTRFYKIKNLLRETGKPCETNDVLAYCQKNNVFIFGDKDGSGSIFDPVLCEVIYNWFAVPNGTILDPFAGGSVRGIVAKTLHLNYTGIELRKEQVEANRENATQIFGGNQGLIEWIVGDSLEMESLLGEDRLFDFIFSCPPYHDLEVYSDIKTDLSNMDYKQFILCYREIISKSLKKLKQDRFAVFVVGEIRDKNGAYKNFIQETKKAFLDNGAVFYNDIIFVEEIGGLPIRAGRAMAATRKIGKRHQNVLVFYKGDIKKIKDNYPLEKMNFLPFLESGEDE